MHFRAIIFLAAATAGAILSGCASNMTPQETAEKAQKYVAKGDLFARNGQHSRAKAEYMAAANLEPTNANYWAMTGEMARRNGDFKEAIEYFLAAVDLQPKDQRIRLALGTTYKQSKLDDEAIAEFTKAIELGGPNPWAAAGLAEIYCAQGYTAKCNEHIRSFDDVFGKQNFAAMTDAQKSSLGALKDKMAALKQSTR
jgi:Flp pilus assembly protein TadD